MFTTCLLYIHHIQLTQINRVTSSVTGDSEWGRTEVKGQTGTACFSSRAFPCLDDDAIGCWTAGLSPVNPACIFLPRSGLACSCPVREITGQAVGGDSSGSEKQAASLSA